MGFGLLFIGYFVANLMTLNPMGAIFRILGYGIILLSIFKLRKYHRAFDFSVFTTVGMLLVSAAAILAEFSIFNKNTVGYILEGASFVFHAFLLYAIFKIAKETEVKKLSDASIRNFIFISAYYLVSVLGYLPFAVIQRVQGELKIVSVLLFFAYLFLDMLLIGQCYANICDEKDADMQRKPSRFAFVNRFREEFDRREEKARAESEAYRKEKMEKRMQRRKK